MKFYEVRVRINSLSPDDVSKFFGHGLTISPRQFPTLAEIADQLRDHS